MIHGLIFDLDGVITHASAEYHYQSWQRLADEEGIPFSRKANDRLRGVPRDESLRRFLGEREISPEQRQAFMARKQTYYLELLAGMTPDDCLPGVMDILETAREKKLPMGVASASRNAHRVLQKLNLADYFEIVGSSAHVGNPKPAPDLFVWVAGYLRIPIPEIIIFEDSEEGVAAARQAGFWTVGVGGANNAHLCVDNLSGITFETIVQQLQAAHNELG